MSTIRTVVICVIIFTIIKTSLTLETADVVTPLGNIRGIQLTDHVTNETIFQFRGIRYGKPPTGRLRFRKPETLSPWNDTYDATSFGSACPQFGVGINTSEDCLYLNIYVPRTLTPSTNMAVMVFIHGGGFTSGYSHQYDGSRLALDGDVIVVTINYRLGILGFLAFNHPASKGNYGLWDQKLAFHWVHDNIASFGGNPSSVTLFGESAGGLSVSYHSVIPSNKGLFHRGIAQSGVLSRTILLRNSTIDKLRKLLPGRTNCSEHDMYDFVECLRNKSIELLLISTDFWSGLSGESLSLETLTGPAVDGELFPVYPSCLLQDPSSAQSKFYKSIDFLAGTNTHEGSVVYMMTTPAMQNFYNFNLSIGIPSRFVCEGIVRPYVELYFNNSSKIQDRLCKFYTTNVSMDAQSRKAADCLQDFIFTPGVAEMLNVHARQGGRHVSVPVLQGQALSPSDHQPPLGSRARVTGTS